MNYAKPALTFEQQADLLLQRGLLADRPLLISRLKAVSYYRLSGYLYPFRLPGTDTFKPGTTLDIIWGRYVFDRQLRLMVLDAIERVEVAIRTAVVNAFTLKYGPFGHINRVNLPNIDNSRYHDWLNKNRQEENRAREVFVKHFRVKYKDETDLPLWMSAELMSFGSLLTLFRGLEKSIKQNLAAEYGVADQVLESWLVSLNTVRNICAHHGRLWDRDLGTPIMTPRNRKHPHWSNPVDVGASPRRMFALLTVLRYMLRIVAPQSRWHDRITYLWTGRCPAIPISQMGFPPHWRDCPIWIEKTGAIP